MATGKSIDAFRFAADYLFERSSVFLWTFTFKKAMPDWAVGSATHLLIRDLQRLHAGNVGGLRVYEVHPGGHGLHVHVLLNRRVNVHEVRRLAKRHGLGRIHVTPCKGRSAADYLTKYLTKDAAKLHKGVRRWAAFGTARRVPVRTVTYQTSEVDSVRLSLGGRKVSFSQYCVLRRAASLTGYVDADGVRC